MTPHHIEWKSFLLIFGSTSWERVDIVFHSTNSESDLVCCLKVNKSWQHFRILQRNVSAIYSCFQSVQKPSGHFKTSLYIFTKLSKTSRYGHSVQVNLTYNLKYISGYDILICRTISLKKCRLKWSKISYVCFFFGGNVNWGTHMIHIHQKSLSGEGLKNHCFYSTFGGVDFLNFYVFPFFVHFSILNTEYVL